MKKSIAIVSICLLIMSSVEAQKKKGEKTQQSAAANEQAIKDVIERETNAFFSVDYDTWMNCWLHSPAAYWSYADTTGINYFEGWKAIEIGFTDYFVTNKPTNFNIERTYQEVRIYDNGAYARFKQRINQNGVKGLEQVEIRVLEKDADNKWKILLVGVLKSGT